MESFNQAIHFADIKFKFSEKNDTKTQYKSEDLFKLLQKNNLPELYTIVNKNPLCFVENEIDKTAFCKKLFTTPKMIIGTNKPYGCKTKIGISSNEIFITINAPIEVFKILQNLENTSTLTLELLNNDQVDNLLEKNITEKLEYIKVLNIKECNFNTQNLNKIIKKLPNLSEISLYFCENILESKEYLNNIISKKIEKLSINKYYTLTVENFNIMTKDTQLKTLKIDCFKENIENIKLPTTLKNLELNDFYTLNPKYNNSRGNKSMYFNFLTYEKIATIIKNLYLLEILKLDINYLNNFNDLKELYNISSNLKKVYKDNDLIKKKDFKNKGFKNKDLIYKYY